MKLHLDIVNQNIYKGCVIVWRTHWKCSCLLRTQSADRKGKTQLRMLSTGPAHSCPMDCCGNRPAHWHSNAWNAHVHTHEDTNIHPQKCINIILIVPLYISKEFRVIHPALSFHPLQCPAVWKSTTVQKNAWLSKGLVLEHLWSYMSVHVFYLWCLHVSMRKLL